MYIGCYEHDDAEQRACYGGSQERMEVWTQTARSTSLHIITPNNCIASRNSRDRHDENQESISNRRRRYRFDDEVLAILCFISAICEGPNFSRSAQAFGCSDLQCPIRSLQAAFPGNLLTEKLCVLRCSSLISRALVLIKRWKDNQVSRCTSEQDVMNSQTHPASHRAVLCQV